MSTPHASQYELESAAFHSMDSGFDAEVAEDLGLTTPENATRQIESGKKVGELLAQASIALAKDNDEWKPGDPYKNGPDSALLDLSAEQKERNRTSWNRIKAEMAEQANKGQ